jgi:hypothetical protein
VNALSLPSNKCWILAGPEPQLIAGCGTACTLPVEVALGDHTRQLINDPSIHRIREGGPSRREGSSATSILSKDQGPVRLSYSVDSGDWNAIRRLSTCSTTFPEGATSTCCSRRLAKRPCARSGSWTQAFSKRRTPDAPHGATVIDRRATLMGSRGRSGGLVRPGAAARSSKGPHRHRDRCRR